jgi:hypothetical protein
VVHCRAGERFPLERLLRGEKIPAMAHTRGSLEDRICGAKDTGLRNLPLKRFAQNQV